MPAKAEPRHHLIRRCDAAQATLDRFKDRPFRWGRNDCARLVAYHMRLLGYQVKLPHSGAYGTLLGAKKALKAAGFADLPEALDAFGLERIAPAAAWAGDILQWPSNNEIAALGVALGSGRMVSFHPHAPGASTLNPLELIAAWRVEVLK